MKVLTKNIIILFLFYYSLSLAQTSFHIGDHNLIIVNDTIHNINYTFDSGSEDTNVFTDSIHYKKNGLLHFLSNPTLLKTGKIEQELIELGNVKTNANILYSSEDNLCIDFDIALGHKILKQHILKFDFSNNVLTKLKKLPDNLTDYTQLELSYNPFVDNYFTRLTINGKQEKLLVDTGNSNGITLKHNKHLTRVEDSIALLGLTAFGIKEIETVIYSKNSVTNGSHTFAIDIVDYSSYNKNILGIGFFLHFEEVIFDIENKVIYLGKERKYNSLRDRIEIDFSAIDETKTEFAIIYLRNSSSYYQTGFRIKDFIRFTNSEFLKKLQADPECNVNKIIQDWYAEHHQFPEFEKITSNY